MAKKSADTDTSLTCAGDVSLYGTRVLSGPSGSVPVMPATGRMLKLLMSEAGRTVPSGDLHAACSGPHVGTNVVAVQAVHIRRALRAVGSVSGLASVRGLAGVRGAGLRLAFRTGEGADEQTEGTEKREGYTYGSAAA
jgi:DNA-binding response OmpR family regulator